MIVEMVKGATEEQINIVVERANSLGFGVQLMNELKSIAQAVGKYI